MMFRLVLMVSMFAVQVARAGEGPTLPGPTKGSCLVPLPHMQGNPTFKGPGNCFDWVGDGYGFDAVKKACTKGVARPTACPTNNVSYTCRQQTKKGQIVVRLYIAPGAANNVYTQDFNERIARQSCKAPWVAFGADLPIRE